MTFLNVALLGGILAAAIPLLIHLFNRRRFHVERWGAMMFLDAVSRANRRKLHLEHMLLLFLRCMIPVALALCMARPVLTGMRSLARRTATSVVVLLDNSYSMAAGDAAQTGFAKAKEAVQDIVARLPRGSEVSVVGLAGPVRGLSEPTYDLPLIPRELRDQKAGFGMARVPHALEASAALFSSRMRHADRELLVVSDFQRTSWSGKASIERRRARGLLEAQPIPPRVVLLRAAVEAVDNVAVRPLILSRPLVGIGQPVSVRAEVCNLGSTPVVEARIYFRVNGMEKAATRVSLAPGETRQLLFTHRFEEAASQLVEVYADADRLKADNTSYASVLSLDRLPVLLVNGAPRPEPLHGETDFLEIALQPYRDSVSELQDLFETHTVLPRDFKPAMLAGFRAVVLANVQRIDEDTLAALSEFVRNGGGLLICPGDQVDLEWYHHSLSAANLLPYRLDDLAGNKDERAASIVKRPYDHPALENFNEPHKGDLSTGRIRHWYRLVRNDTSPGEKEARVLAWLDTGDPFLVEQTCGEGRVILSCLPCDADWSNFPLRAFYLPLMRDLVVHLASTVFPPRNIEVGEIISVLTPKEDVNRKAALVDPGGTRHELTVVGKSTHGVAEFDHTQKPGVYLVQLPSGEVAHYTVATATGESDLERIDGGEFEALADELGAQVVDSAEEYHELEHKRRYGREIWKFLLGLVVLLLFAELFLADSFQRRTT